MPVPKPPRPHLTVPLKFCGETVHIDQKIAPLLQEIWKAGISTEQCCQSDRGRVWIQFSSSGDLEGFVRTVATTASLELRRRMNPHPFARRPRSHLWWYEINVHDYMISDGPDEDEDAMQFDAGCPLIVVLCGVRFPCADYGEVHAAFVSYNKNVAEVGQEERG